MEIILTTSNKICIKQNNVLIEFDAELATEIIHGLNIAMAEAGRRVNEVHRESLVLEIPEAITVSAYDLDD